MASNPGRIPAGGKDKISVVVHTQNRGDSNINKRFTVHTNDPIQSKTVLSVSGKIKGYVRIKPKYIRLLGKTGQELRQTVKVLPFKEFPFKVRSVTAREGKHLRYELKPLPRKKEPQGYLLIVYNTMEAAGSYQDRITIETDSKVKPKIEIPVYGRIQNALPQALKKNTQ